MIIPQMHIPKMRATLNSRVQEMSYGTKNELSYKLDVYIMIVCKTTVS